MANTLNLGNGNWATKKDSLLAYNSENNNYKPLPFDFSRGSSATRINKDDLIETVGIGESRIDFQGNTKGALLLEPQRTNLLPYSEDFSNSNWINQSTDTTLSVVSNGSPDGGAFYRCTSGSNGGGRIVDVYSGSLTGGVFSIYAKGSGSLRIDLFINGGGNINKTVTLTSEWKRYNVYNPQTNNAGDVSIRFFANSVADIFGAQVESGSYAASYIPTTGSAVTRLAEACSQTTPYGVIGQTEGTVYIDFLSVNNFDGSSGQFFQIKEDNNNRINVYYSNRTARLFGIKNAVGVFNQSLPLITGSTCKLAIKYNSTSTKVFINGSLIYTLDGINNIAFNDCRFSPNNNINYNEIKLYNTALTDQELQALTNI